MIISSSAFQNNSSMPPMYTCDGKDISPPLSFSEVPASAKSLALIVDDPDAPNGDWVHWLVWNIDPAITTLEENSLPAEALAGTTSFGESAWGGPCPPSGVHHYQFKLYALDNKLDLQAGAQKNDLQKAIQGHILAQAMLVGLYQRQ